MGTFNGYTRLEITFLNIRIRACHVQRFSYVPSFLLFKFHLGPHTSVLSEHRPELPYTDAFLHEVLRMKPNGPIGLPRETTCDTSVGKYCNEIINYISRGKHRVHFT